MRNSRRQPSLNLDSISQGRMDFESPESQEDGSAECLGLTFESDEERRGYFLQKLREGLEELHAKLGGMPFTTVEDAFVKMKLVVVGR